MSLQVSLLKPVGYLGKKALKTDMVYGTDFSWVPGQVHEVPAQIAQQMHVKHPDVYALADSDRWKQYMAGTLPDNEVVPEPLLTADTKVSELVAQLGIELNKLPNKGLVAKHDLVEKLRVTFAEDATKTVMVETIQAAYRTNLEANPERVDEVYQARLGTE
ncbi:MAG: hypothetical protein K2W88_17640 [Pararheinheimera sp.]|nr:hypothetical protein [Rheinheimera sp.]